MPENLKDLRRRVRSIKSTKQITRAMEMVSAAKQRRVQSALMAARPFVNNLQLLLGRLASAADVKDRPLFTRPSGAPSRTTLVLVTGDRGLCGSYNANLVRHAERAMAACRQHEDVEPELVCIGRRGAEHFERVGEEIVRRFTEFGGELDRAKSDALAEFLRDRFLSAETGSVRLIYNRFVSTSVSHTQEETYLPLDPESLLSEDKRYRRGSREYLFEPDRETVLEEIAPAYLKAKAYIMLAESFTSEHSARMLAMNNASKNCDEMVDTLTLRLNKARQSAITRDLLDIVGGAEALTRQG